LFRVGVGGEQVAGRGGQGQVSLHADVGGLEHAGNRHRNAPRHLHATLIQCLRQTGEAGIDVGAARLGRT
jgi:hypothetical protein